MKKIIISFTLVIMVVLSPLMIVSAESNVSGHVDHPGSENCIYSCILDNAVTVIPESNIDYISEEYTDIVTEERLIDAINEYTGIYTESLVEAKTALAEMWEISVEELDVLIPESSLYCAIVGHVLNLLPCAGNHSSPDSNCYVNCTRTLICLLDGCTWSGTVTERETSHS